MTGKKFLIRGFEKVIQVYFFLMVIMIPMERISFRVSSFRVSLGGHTYKYIPYGLLLWSVLLILKRRERPRFVRTPLDVPILIYLFVCLLSLFTSYDLKASLEELMYIVTYFLWFYLIVNHIKEERQIAWILIALLIGSIYISLYGLHHFFILGKWAVGLGGYLRLGAYFAMTVPIILGQSLWGRRSFWWRLSFGLGALLMLMTVPLTSARGSWLGLLGAILFLGFRWDKRILAVLVAVLLLFSFLSPQPVRLRAKSLASMEHRLSDWKVALDMVTDRPFSGVGLGDAYLTMYPKYRPGSLYRRAHNLYLYQAASVGIPGLVVYIWLLVVFFQSGLQSIKKEGRSVGWKWWSFWKEEPRPRAALLASILAGVTGILIASFTDEHFHATEVSMTFWLLMGLGVSLMQRKLPNNLGNSS